ncbi:MAG: urocanate hydratase [Bacteriovoracaceae bacterium]|nr:urocanate hydratase [Bacteriovoracaceae bacterium]
MEQNKTKFVIPLPPTGSTLNCKGWHQEAALRCLLNNLHPEVAEDRDNLIVYGGKGKAARDLKSLEILISTLKRLGNEETLLVQSGKPVAVFPSQKTSPRVLIANSNLVGNWSNWDHFHELEKKGLMMYGQMTAGSWIYIGTQGIIQGTYETFMSAAKIHFNSTLKGRIVLSAGLGGMGGAQPLSVKIAEGVFVGCDVDEERIKKRLKSKYLDHLASSFEEAWSMALKFKEDKVATSVGVVGNAADFFEYVLKQKVLPDLVTDQTSAHDPLDGYVPKNLSLAAAKEMRSQDPKKYMELAYQTMGDHVQSMLEFQKRGCFVFDYGNNLRAGAMKAGVEKAFAFPGFVPAYIRPLFCEGSGPFRWVALSGDPKDIEVSENALCELFPENKKLKTWIAAAKKHIQFQGLPSRICWLNYFERAAAGELFNRLVREKKISAPMVIGRDHLDCGSVASPYRETESMLDGSDAVADWPLLNAMINVAGGASWISLHNGGGVGIGYSQHSGMVILCDGSLEMDQRLALVLNSDSGMGIVRHADAGYDLAAQSLSRTKNFSMPCMPKEN